MTGVDFYSDLSIVMAFGHGAVVLLHVFPLDVFVPDGRQTGVFSEYGSHRSQPIMFRSIHSYLYPYLTLLWAGAWLSWAMDWLSFACC